MLSAILQSIVLFFENNNIGVLFTILGTIAVFYYAIRVTISHQTSLLSTAKYFLAFFIILSTLIYNTATVTVIDESNPGWTPQQIVKVPYGIAFLWSGFTTIQYALVKDFTNDFSVPAGDNLITEGVGVSIMQQTDSATITTANSYLYQDYNEYIANCVAPGISTGAVNVSQLLASGNATNAASPTYSANTMQSIWTTMSNFTAGAGGGILTNWYSGTSANSVTEQASGGSFPGGTSTTCLNETTWLQTAVQDYITQDAGPAIAGEMQFATFSEFANALGVINPYMFNMQQTGMTQLTQAVGVNMYAPAILKMAAASGASASSLAYATGEGMVTTQQGMYESGILAGKYMPIVFGLFEALFLVASVIILILMVTHMGLKYLKLMFEILTMIAIWPALTAGFNYITQLIIQQQYGPYSGLGYSVSASGTINSFLSGSLAWMGYFSWSVPMMAYAIASGSSYAMTSMVGGMDSAISKNASVKGAGAGMGNLTAGVDKYNNMLGNNWSVTHTQNTGYKAPHTDIEEGMTTSTTNPAPGVVAHNRSENGQVATSVENQGNINLTLGMGANKQLDAMNYQNNTLSGVTTKQETTAIQKDLSSSDSQLLKDGKTINSVVSYAKTNRSNIEASLTKTGMHGQTRNTAVSSGFKTSTNSTTDSKNTASASFGAALGKILTLGAGDVASTGLLKSTGTAHASGVSHKLNTEKKLFTTMADSKNTTISAEGKKGLSAIKDHSDTLSLMKTYKQDLKEVKSGTFSLGGSIIPAYINQMTPSHTRGGFANTLLKVDAMGTSINGIAEFVKGATEYKNMSQIPGVGQKINEGETNLENETKKLTPKAIGGKYNNAKNQGSGYFNAVYGQYANQHSQNQNYLTSHIAPPHFITGTSAGNVPHGNPTVNHALAAFHKNPYNTTVGFAGGLIFGPYSQGLMSNPTNPNPYTLQGAKLATYLLNGSTHQYKRIHNGDFGSLALTQQGPRNTGTPEPQKQKIPKP